MKIDVDKFVSGNKMVSIFKLQFNSLPLLSLDYRRHNWSYQLSVTYQEYNHVYIKFDIDLFSKISYTMQIKVKQTKQTNKHTNVSMNTLYLVLLRAMSFLYLRRT